MSEKTKSIIRKTWKIMFFPLVIVLFTFFAVGDDAPIGLFLVMLVVMSAIIGLLTWFQSFLQGNKSREGRDEYIAKHGVDDEGNPLPPSAPGDDVRPSL